MSGHKGRKSPKSVRDEGEQLLVVRRAKFEPKLGRPATCCARDAEARESRGEGAGRGSERQRRRHARNGGPRSQVEPAKSSPCSGQAEIR